MRRIAYGALAIIFLGACLLFAAQRVVLIEGGTRTS
jgi:hypothetical protein